MPHFLSFVLSLSLAGSTFADGIKYGSGIFLQNNFKDFEWLRGAKNRFDDGVDTMGYNLPWVQKWPGLKLAFEWYVRSTGDVPSYQDPKSGECLKYGDKFYLQSNYNRYLSGSDGASGATVVTKPFGPMPNQTFGLIVRSTRGTGVRSSVENRDPAQGECVQYRDIVYLQNDFMDLRWVAGARGSGGNGVITRNILESDKESNEVAATYEWILRSRLDTVSGKRPGKSDSLIPSTAGSTT